MMENQINKEIDMEYGLNNTIDGSDWTPVSWSDEVPEYYICRDEHMEIIHKALVIAHQQFVSWGNYDEALKITKLIAENLDDR